MPALLDEGRALGLDLCQAAFDGLGEVRNGKLAVFPGELILNRLATSL